LETKVRHLEKQLADNREQLKELEAVKGERDRFNGIIGKLQGKCQAFHQEVGELKANAKEVESELERLSRHEAEAESILELATLDREMAEERAEQAETELDEIRQRLEEKEMELEILKEEATLLTENMSEEQKQEAGYYRLQTENERLKNALLRLRDITEEDQNDLKHRIRELEGDQAQTDQLREQNTELQTQLSQRESRIEDLEQQIDAANAYEEIVEELSEQNQRIKDQLAEKDMVIKDLENLKELNDELEIHHIEQANDLRAELDGRDVELAEQTQKITEQDAAMVEQEVLITKFRDVVLDLQTKMNDAESSKTMSEEQAKDVTGRFNEVMELNRRLRNASLNNTIKTITSELQKLQAEQAEEELAMVKSYLPNSSDVYQSDSLRVYFTAKRVAFTSNLSRSLMKSLSFESQNLDEADRFQSELLRIDTVYQLTTLNLKSSQFWSAVASSTLEQYSTFGPMYEELMPVEKTVQRCLDSLKSDDMNLKDLSESLRRSNIVLSGVTSDLQDALTDRPEDEIIFRVSSIKASFDLIRASFEAVKSFAHTIGLENGESGNEVVWFLEYLSKPADESTESIVAADKLLKTLSSLKDGSLYPRFPLGIEDIIKQDDFLRRAAQGVSTFAVKLTQYMLLFPREEDQQIPATVLEKQAKLLQDAQFPDDELSFVGDVIVKLNFWNDYASVLSNTAEFERGPAPWVLKAKEMEAEKKKSAEETNRLQKLAAEHHAAMLQIRERDDIIETKELENEHLKAKSREAATKLDDLVKMREDYHKVQREFQDYQATVKKEMKEMQLRAEQDRSAVAEPVVPTPIAEAGITTKAPAATTNVSATFVTAMQALKNENQWLRRREQSEMFDQNIKELQNKVNETRIAETRREARHKQKAVDEMLYLSMCLEEVVLSKHTETNAAQSPQQASKTAVLEIPSIPNRHTLSPILLPPLKTPSLAWAPKSTTPDFFLMDMEENWGYEDLSPVAEEFDKEMLDSIMAY
jgi:dynactin 1